MAKLVQRCGVVHVSMEFDFASPPKGVWTAFARDMHKWWHRDHFSDARAKAMKIETRLGGRWFESWGQGRGRVWHTVVTCDPPRLLETTGPLFPQFGGPAMSMLRLEFTPRGKGTKLLLSDAIFGAVSTKTKKSFESGWKAVLGEALTAYINH
jgi:uncharacterized protein YndB with AHSA1/START domain